MGTLDLSQISRMRTTKVHDENNTNRSNLSYKELLHGFNRIPPGGKVVNGNAKKRDFTIDAQRTVGFQDYSATPFVN